MKRYTVITALFGNYECLRDNQYQRNDVDYLCITDNPNLKSNTWKILLNPKQLNPEWSTRKKTYYVRYHLFEFCNTPNAIWIDGSIELNDISSILDYFDNGIYNILHLGGYQFKKWFKHFSLYGENCKYIDNVNKEHFLFYHNKIQNLLEYLNTKNIDMDNQHFYHISGCLRIVKNNEQIKSLMNECWELLNSEDLMKNPFNFQCNKNEIFYDIYYYDEIVFGLVCRDNYLDLAHSFDDFPFTIYNHNSKEIRQL